MERRRKSGTMALSVMPGSAFLIFVHYFMVKILKSKAIKNMMITFFSPSKMRRKKDLQQTNISVSL